ncbi:chromosomal replication initiator protein DnaA [Candidatus Woesebacteria bacterium RIFCSPHIGHO2_01_FULL_38_10]|uniref:Chromosomal replication initiator protein DnaA n=1 Tax=Candidatus Woesebacteria bacterium RIFCSPLOWO2_01_FULL_39_10b TaxID=1802517 RepID=A0A1F8BAF2_9BACT|nr:MAG: chromosomal replication initiator protein DnaA [Candidatus Woesebacteria bacterium RIFCSPHIGHO2_01_FULL_38_10]OGM60348.1 MAG: chromosomal replication initiator protein DnaA [Candidatus Woesebacteria bacterium RIFCSPLOWO2_01_FULL_39_10b]
MIDKTSLWHDILESIKVSVSTPIFNTWFGQTHLASLKKNEKRYQVEIGCSSGFIKSTIETRYFGLIQNVLTKTLNLPCDISFVVKENRSRKPVEETTPTPLFEKVTNLNNAFIKSGLRLGFTFDNFAVSSSNQLAHAAAEAVSNQPGAAYNPLFIWGGVGVGKTHLMNAVGYSLIDKQKETKIISCTGEQFTNDIVEGIRNRSTSSVREKYRKLKILLIDDIQFIAGKDAVQEEFFHTFNALVISGAQIIMTSDKPPTEISKLEERLRSRFEAGLIVDIAPPDFELRCAIVQIKTQERDISLPMDFVQIIAGNVESARKIEGFLVKLSSEIKHKKLDITQELILSLLGKEVKSNNVIKTTPARVISATSKHFSIGKRVLLGSSRTRKIARPRQILMYLLRTQLGFPLQEVGDIVGGRDHTTVIHAVDKITQLVSTDVQIREDIRGIKNML